MTKQKGVIKLICTKLIVTNVGLVHRLTLGINIGIKKLDYINIYYTWYPSNICTPLVCLLEKPI